MFTEKGIKDFGLDINDEGIETRTGYIPPGGVWTAEERAIDRDWALANSIPDRAKNADLKFSVGGMIRKADATVDALIAALEHEHRKLWTSPHYTDGTIKPEGCDVCALLDSLK